MKKVHPRQNPGCAYEPQCLVIVAFKYALYMYITLCGCDAGNAADDSPVLGHLSRDAAAAEMRSASFVVVFSASLLQLLVRLTAVAGVTR